MTMPARQGLHARRLPAPLPDVALWDVLGTVALGLLLHALVVRDRAHWGVTVLGCFAAGAAVHSALGVRTPWSRGWPYFSSAL